MNVMNAALGGMQIAQSSFEKTAQCIADTSIQPPIQSQAQKPDSVDLSAQAVALIADRNQFQANAQVFHAGDQLQKKLLDLMA